MLFPLSWNIRKIDFKFLLRVARLEASHSISTQDLGDSGFKPLVTFAAEWTTNSSYDVIVKFDNIDKACVQLLFIKETKLKL